MRGGAHLSSNSACGQWKRLTLHRIHGEDLLSRVHRHGRALRSDTEAEHKTRDEEVWPGVREALPDAGDEREDAGDEDRASAADQAVQLESTVRGGQSGVTEQGHY